MSALGEAFGNYGAQHTFKLRGTDGEIIKVYALRLIDDYVKSELEKNIFERQRDVLFSLRAGYSPSEYKERLDKLSDDYMTGKFSPFTSEEGQKYLTSTHGALQVMALIFQCPVTEAMVLGSSVENQSEIETLIKVVMQESFRGIDMRKIETEAVNRKRETASPTNGTSSSVTEGNVQTGVSPRKAAMPLD